MRAGETPASLIGYWRERPIPFAQITVAAPALVTGVGGHDFYGAACFHPATPRSILRCCTGRFSPLSLPAPPALCTALAAHTRPLHVF